MSITFAWSFDEPSPSSGWSTSFSVVSGRHGNGALVGTFVQPTRSIPTGSKYFGAASKRSSFFNTALHVSGNQTKVEISTSLGDGRFQLTIQAFDQSQDVILIPNFVATKDQWNYNELYADITEFSATDNGNGTSTVSIEISYEVKIDNNSHLSGTYNRVFIKSNPIPTPDITIFGMFGPGSGESAVYDDIYFSDSGFLGDCRAYYDSSSNQTFAVVDTAQPIITQKLIEIGILPIIPYNNVRLTQKLIEVGVLPISPNNSVRLTQKLIEVGIGTGFPLSNKWQVSES